MLAIDTNLVVRYLTGDHPGQSAQARALIDGADVFVCTTLLLETGMDFADALHVAKAAGCEAFVSFDTELAKAAGRAGCLTVRAP